MFFESWHANSVNFSGFWYLNATRRVIKERIVFSALGGNFLGHWVRLLYISRYLYLLWLVSLCYRDWVDEYLGQGPISPGPAGGCTMEISKTFKNFEVNSFSITRAEDSLIR